MKPDPDSKLRRRVRAFRDAARGISTVLASQPHARFHAFATVCVIAAGCYFRVSRMEWCALVFAITLVWTAEAVNTALEFLTDLVQPEQHPLAGKAKDAAAAGVLLASIGAAIVGALVFLPKLGMP
jgi:diacylglycerol kinase